MTSLRQLLREFKYERVETVPITDYQIGLKNFPVTFQITNSGKCVAEYLTGNFKSRIVFENITVLNGYPELVIWLEDGKERTICQWRLKYD